MKEREETVELDFSPNLNKESSLKLPEFLNVPS